MACKLVQKVITNVKKRLELKILAPKEENLNMSDDEVIMRKEVNSLVKAVISNAKSRVEMSLLQDSNKTLPSQSLSNPMQSNGEDTLSDVKTSANKQSEESVAQDPVEEVNTNAKKKLELELLTPKEDNFNNSGNTDDEAVIRKEVKSLVKTVISNAKSRVEMSLLQDSNKTLPSQSLISNPMQSNGEDTLTDEQISKNKQSEEIVAFDLVEEVITNAKKRLELELLTPKEDNFNNSGNTDDEAVMRKEVKSLVKTVISNAKSRVEMSLLQDSNKTLPSQSLSNPMQEDTLFVEQISKNKQSEEIVACDLVEEVITNAKKRLELELLTPKEDNFNNSGNTDDEAVMRKEVKSLVKTVISNAKSRVEMSLLQDSNKTLPSQSLSNPMQEDTLFVEQISKNKQSEEIVACDLVEEVITNAKKRLELELLTPKEDNFNNSGNTDDEAVMRKEVKSLVKTVISNAKSRVEMSLLQDSNKTIPSQSLSNPMQSNGEDTLSDVKTSAYKQSEESVARDPVEEVNTNAKKKLELELLTTKEDNFNNSGNTDDEAVMRKEVKSLVKTVISNAKSRVEMSLYQDSNKTLPSQSLSNPMQSNGEDTLSDVKTSANKQSEESVAQDPVEEVTTNAKKRLELELLTPKEDNFNNSGNTDDEAVMRKEVKSLVKTVISNSKSSVEMSLYQDSSIILPSQSISNPMQSNGEDTLSDEQISKIKQSEEIVACDLDITNAKKKLELELLIPKEDNFNNSGNTDDEAIMQKEVKSLVKTVISNAKSRVEMSLYLDSSIILPSQSLSNPIQSNGEDTLSDEQISKNMLSEEIVACDLIEKVIANAKKRLELELLTPKEDNFNTSCNTDDEAVMHKEVKSLVKTVISNAKSSVELSLLQDSNKILSSQSLSNPIQSNEVVMHKEVKSLVKTVISNAKSSVEMSLLQDSLSSQSLSDPMQSNNEDKVSDEITSTSKQSEEIVVKDLVEKVITNAKKRVELELPSPREENLNPSGNTDYEAMCKEVKSLVKTVIFNAKSRVEMSLLEDSNKTQSLSNSMQSNEEDTLSDKKLEFELSMPKEEIKCFKIMPVSESFLFSEEIEDDGITINGENLLLSLPGMPTSTHELSDSNVARAIVNHDTDESSASEDQNLSQVSSYSFSFYSPSIVSSSLASTVPEMIEDSSSSEIESYQEMTIIKDSISLTQSGYENALREEAKALTNQAITNAKKRVESSMLLDQDQCLTPSSNGYLGNQFNMSNSCASTLLSETLQQETVSVPLEPQQSTSHPCTSSLVGDGRKDDEDLHKAAHHFVQKVHQRRLELSMSQCDNSNQFVQGTNFPSNFPSSCISSNLTEQTIVPFIGDLSKEACDVFGQGISKSKEIQQTSDQGDASSSTCSFGSHSKMSNNCTSGLLEETNGKHPPLKSKFNKKGHSPMNGSLMAHAQPQRQTLSHDKNWCIGDMNFMPWIQSLKIQQPEQLPQTTLFSTTDKRIDVPLQLPQACSPEHPSSASSEVSGTLVPEDQCFVPSQFEKMLHKEKSLTPSTILSAVYSYSYSKWLNSYSELEDSFQLQNTELSMPSTILSAVHSYPIKNSCFDKEDSLHTNFYGTKNCTPFTKLSSVYSYPISIDKNPSYSSIEKGSFNPSTPEYDRTSLELKETQISESEFARVSLSEYDGIVTAGDKIGLSGALPKSVAEVNSKTSLLQNLNVRSETSPFQIQLKKGFFSAGIKLGLNEMDMLTITSISSTNIIGLGGNLRYVDVIIKHSSQKIFPLF